MLGCRNLFEFFSTPVTAPDDEPVTAPDDEPITPVSTPSPSNDSEPPKKPRVRLTLAQKLCIHSEILQVHNQRFTQKFTQKMQENVGRTRFGPKKPRIIEVRVQSRRVKSRDDCRMHRL